MRRIPAAVWQANWFSQCSTCKLAWNCYKNATTNSQVAKPTQANWVCEATKRTSEFKIKIQAPIPPIYLAKVNIHCNMWQRACIRHAWETKFLYNIKLVPPCNKVSKKDRNQLLIRSFLKTSVNDFKESDVKAHGANSVKVETESPVSNAGNEKVFKEAPPIVQK